ncbi:SRR1 family protein [Aspergillus aculeatinus CBS 121060]|uniref:Uncharacterized protein n=1 Tax=Aspergillus aculeatinus CBS 121060 TaxID=1448322 RepID=A0ACD1HE42_9EURO|nr:hypothetical protein BO66DRAFT_447896 [Aspergillus aculeatinus CBS 121060]RAH71680.1 hypothetical protein BO66DRAFT_447896 [Aspergillus aculeatinus CBS 121060]
MPHTSRKKKPTTSTSTGPTKRTTITDATGWTHVTTTGNAHRAHRQHRPQSHPHPQPQQQELLTPAEAPKSLTLPSLLTQYHTHRTKWTASTTAATLTATRTEQGAQSTTPTTPRITNIICIGLGSPSGFLRGGWVDRRSVSLYQLNALMSVVECLTANQKTSTVRIYAQDPVFNALDRQLLAALGITVVEHPDGFGKVNSNSLLFCPGAEKAHLEVLLARNPAGVVGGPLEDTGSDGIERFVARTGSVRLPRFEELKEAFWEMRVYHYTQPVEEENRED